MKFRSLALRPLFIFTFSILGCVILTVGGYLLWFDNKIERSSKDTVTAIQAMEAAQSLQEHLFAHKRHYLLGGLTGNPARIRAGEEAQSALLNDLNRLDKLEAYSFEGLKSDLSEVHSSIENYLSGHKQLRDQRLSAIELYRAISEKFELAYDSTEALIQFNVTSANNKQKTLDQLGHIASVVGTIIILFCFIAIGILAFVLRTSLFEPLAALKAAILEMKRTRSFIIRAPTIGSTDIKAISNCFNELGADLEEYQKTQFRFIATVAHDIKNPLGAMSMSADLLSEEMTQGEAQEALEILKRQIVSLQRIVKDLLESSTIQAGNVGTELKDFNLNDLVAKCISLHRLTAPSHEMVFSPSSDEGVFISDPDRITQVMNNLLSNAIKYSPQGGKVEVRIQHKGQQYEIQVKDYGIGIPVENLETIFYPFKRGSNANENVSGTGLGLFSCKRIINILGGEIFVQSQTGQGSTFTVVLPERGIPTPKADANSMSESMI